MATWATGDGPVDVDPAHFFDFISSATVAVVLVAVHPAHAFNHAVSHRLREADLGEVALGTVPLFDLMLRGASALPYLTQGLRDCGGPSGFGVLPGYWLFRGGRVLAWHPGLPTRADAPRIARKTILQALWAAFAQRWAVVGEALYAATEDAAAEGVANAFCASVLADQAHERAAGGGASRTGDTGPRSQARPFRDPADELAWAYRTLGVTPAATDQEVKDAWRDRRVEFHPDLAAGDPAEFARRSRLSADINRARDVIFASRGGRGARARAAA